MEPGILHHLGIGVSLALTWYNLFFCFIGVFVGTLVGVLPGLGPAGALSLLIAVTYKMPTVTALIMLAGIYYGSMYGGSTTSILVNIPGEAASVVTCLDGYQMARKGRAGPALGIAAFGSFIAGTLGCIGLMFLAPLLGRIALKFGPSEYFAMTVFGLTMVTSFSRGSKIKAAIAAVLGLLVGCIGIDPITGAQRLNYGSITLLDGVGLVPVAVGLFGIGEVLANIALGMEAKDVYKTNIKGLLPNLQDWKISFWPIMRGSVLGFFMGILPGPSITIASFAAYALEKKISRHPEKFGTGVIEAVASPEAANNSATCGAFIPLVSLGIPSSVSMALFMGALLIHGVSPSPLFISEHPDIFWGFIASMYIGNIMLLVLNLPLIGIWIKLLRIPYSLLFPFILLFCLIGVYFLNNNVWEIFIMLIFGVFGYVNQKTGFDAPPFLLGLVLGPMMERKLRESLLLSHGNPLLIVSHPIAAVLLAIALFSIMFSFIRIFKKKTFDQATTN